MIDVIGGRKAFYGLVIIALGAAAAFKLGDIPANLERLLEIIFATFVVGNVTNTVAASRAGAMGSTKMIESAATDLSPITAELQSIRAQNEAIAHALSTSQQGIGFLVSYVSQQPAPAASQTTAYTQAAANRAVINNT
jgi:hypothetical protein